LLAALAKATAIPSTNVVAVYCFLPLDDLLVCNAYRTRKPASHFQPETLL